MKVYSASEDRHLERGTKEKEVGGGGGFHMLIQVSIPTGLFSAFLNRQEP